MDFLELSQTRVAICDDSPTNVAILSKLVESEGVKSIESFTDPRLLLSYLRRLKGDIDLLILDIAMPHLDGFQVMQQIRADFGTELGFAILVITGLNSRETRNQALQSGANDFLDKPFDPLEVTLRVRNLLRVQRSIKAQVSYAQVLEQEVEKRTQELNMASEKLVYLLALAGEMRDMETGKHVLRVGRLSRLLAEGAGLPETLCYMVEKAAPLHDVGKIGIPDRILHKDGPLDQAERQEMDTHTEKGLKLIGAYADGSQLLQMAARIAHSHHERWDGKGYPRGLRGRSIPLEGRIVALADVFDALTSRRPYKEPWPIERVKSFIHEQAGSHFDPELAQYLLDQFDRFLEVMEELADDPEELVDPQATGHRLQREIEQNLSMQ
ncbi:MAG: response regulator [Gammaproteobacteria bacterium]|nr:response regulator [Gammaproteobacteria bacterium]